MARESRNEKEDEGKGVARKTDYKESSPGYIRQDCRQLGRRNPLYNFENLEQTDHVLTAVFGV